MQNIWDYMFDHCDKMYNSKSSCIWLGMRELKWKKIEIFLFRKSNNREPKEDPFLASPGIFDNDNDNDNDNNNDNDNKNDNDSKSDNDQDNENDNNLGIRALPLVIENLDSQGKKKIQNLW